MSNTIEYTRYETWKGWDEYFSIPPLEQDYFARECGNLPTMDADVHEIGFGTGAFLAWCRARGCRISGSEINDRSCREAEAAGVTLLPVNLSKAAEAYPESFDLIAAFDVLEHLRTDGLPDDLNAICGMLRPGGYLIARFPNGQSPFGLVPQNGDLTHRTALSLSCLQQILPEGRFEVIRYSGAAANYGHFGTHHLIRRLRRLLQRAICGFLGLVFGFGVPLDPVVVVVLRKKRN